VVTTRTRTRKEDKEEAEREEREAATAATDNPPSIPSHQTEKQTGDHRHQYSHEDDNDDELMMPVLMLLLLEASFQKPLCSTDLLPPLLPLHDTQARTPLQTMHQNNDAGVMLSRLFFVTRS